MKKRNRVNNSDCYKRLSIAVIRRACIDYVNALKMLEKYPNNSDAKIVKCEVEDFFFEDMGFYSDLHPDYLISGLRKMAKTGKRINITS